MNIVTPVPRPPTAPIQGVATTETETPVLPPRPAREPVTIPTDPTPRPETPPGPAVPLTTPCKLPSEA